MFASKFGLMALSRRVFSESLIRFCSSPVPNGADQTVIDIDGDAMMEEEDEELTGDSDSRWSLAPVDIDPWVDEYEVKQGTVDLVEEKPLEYPPIPAVRLGHYEFRGIKVFLPQRLLTAETYRYRLEEKDQQLADDIRVCNFEKP